MDLRNKTRIVVGIFLACLILILYMAAQMQLKSSFSDLEERTVEVDVDRARNAISNELISLGDLANFWAARDDIYAFVTTGNPNFVNYSMSSGSLTNDSLYNTEINLLLFMDSNGQIIFSRFLNVSGQTEEVPQNSIEQLSLYGFCPGCLDKKSKFSGIIMLSGQPMMIVAQPITNSKKDLPSTGRVVLGRFLNQKSVDKLYGVTQLNLTIYSIGDPRMPEDFRLAQSRLSYNSPIFVKLLDGEHIAGYALITSIYGNPLMILGVNVSRELYRQGERSMKSFMVLFSAAGLLFLVMTLLYLDRSVLSRLINLTTGITNIGKSPDSSKYLKVQGDDELANLAISINDMLASLESAHKGLVKSQQQMSDIISFLPEAIMAIDLNGKVIIWNQAMEILTGIMAKDILGKDDFEYSLPFYGYRRPILIDMVLMPHEGWEAEYFGFKREGMAVVGEVFIPTFGPRGSFLLAKATALCDEIGNTVGAIESVRDMTERRLMEQKLERSKTELHVAAEIQRSFIPKSTPDIPNFEVAAITIPAMEVGGDFYDFILMPDGNYGLVIADVAGKSISAALFMALSRMIIRASAAHQSRATEVLKNANNMIASDATAGMFVTLLFGVLDGVALTLKYANAGHPTPLIFKSRDCRYIEEKASGIALGAKEGVSYEQQTIKFEPGDVAVFYTDGVTEATNIKEELLGLNRLIGAINKACHSSAEEIMAKILEEVLDFRGVQEQNDDITVMVLKASRRAEKHDFITIHSKDEEIHEVTEELEKIMSEAGFAVKEVLDMQLAVEEACINIVRHGYRGTHGDIMISFDFKEDRLIVTIEDNAHPFDPTQFEKPNFSADLEQRPIGGLGIHLMRSLTDEMRYEYKNRKNRLRLIKINDKPLI